MIKNAARAWLGIFSTNALILACGVATGVLAARLLLPEGRGELATVLFWPQLIAGIGILSLHESVTYKVSQQGADEDSIISVAFYLSLVLAIIVVAISYLLLPFLLGPDRQDLVPLSMIYLLLFVPMNFVALCLLAIDHGGLKLRRYNAHRAMVPAIYLVGLIFLWANNAVSVEGAVWANLCGNFSVVLIAIWYARNKLFFKPLWKDGYSLIVRGVRFHSVNILVLIRSQVDRLIVISFLGSIQIGLYAVALTIAASGISIITNSFHTLMFPTITRKKTLVEQGQYLARCLRYSMLLIVSLTAILIVVTPWIVPFLFGNEFESAVIPTIILLLAYIPMALREIIVRSLRGLGESRPGFVSEIIVITVFLLTAWALLGKYGLTSVAVSLMAANAISIVYFCFYLRKRLDIHVYEWWGLNVRTLVEVMQYGRSLFKKQSAIGL